MDSLPSRVTVEPDKASPARVYDWFLGGSHNFAVDREVAARTVELMPEVPDMARANRHFLRRAVLAAAQAGIDQFLDLGSGIPTVGNVHEVAREVHPAARVAYVDLDPVAVEHSRAILGDDPDSYVLQGDLLDPASVLADEGVRALLDLRRPVCVLMVAVGHFVADTDAFAAAIAAYRDAVASGSELVMSHGSSERRTAETDEVVEIYHRRAASTRGRDRAEMARLLEGWQPVEPGLTEIQAWRPEPDAAEPPFSRFSIWGVVAVKP
jgi:SAM-dependent methyltransferase